MEAAVSVVLRAREEVDFLLIRRAVSERDPWSGQMALPGGRWDRTDSGLLHTAMRETMEETGVDLQRIGMPLGRLDDVAPVSARLPKLRIAPFVFGVPPETEAIVASHELDGVFWISLDTLRLPETRSSIDVDFPIGVQAYPSYRLAGGHVWGLTHRILSHFLEQYHKSEVEAPGNSQRRGDPRLNVS